MLWGAGKGGERKSSQKTSIKPQAETLSETTWGVPAEPPGPILLFTDNPESQEFVTTVRDDKLKRERSESFCGFPQSHSQDRNLGVSLHLLTTPPTKFIKMYNESSIVSEREKRGPGSRAGKAILLLPARPLPLRRSLVGPRNVPRVRKLSDPGQTTQRQCKPTRPRPRRQRPDRGTWEQSPQQAMQPILAFLETTVVSTSECKGRASSWISLTTEYLKEEFGVVPSLLVEVVATTGGPYGEKLGEELDENSELFAVGLSLLPYYDEEMKPQRDLGLDCWSKLVISAVQEAEIGEWQ
ncbi:hypothetical protein STEG23_001405, partial [Scotinomys teguina]